MEVSRRKVSWAGGPLWLIWEFGAFMWWCLTAAWRTECLGNSRKVAFLLAVRAFRAMTWSLAKWDFWHSWRQESVRHCLAASLASTKSAGRSPTSASTNWKSFAESGLLNWIRPRRRSPLRPTPATTRINSIYTYNEEYNYNRLSCRRYNGSEKNDS